MLKILSYIPQHRRLSDSTLRQMKKSELIEYIRLLEHNWNVAMEFNEQQSKNITKFLNEVSQFSIKGADSGDDV